VAKIGDSIDSGVVHKEEEDKHKVMTSCQSLPSKLVEHSWVQQANIIFLSLHPWTGKKNTTITSELTGVNEHTLVGWLS